MKEISSYLKRQDIRGTGYKKIGKVVIVENEGNR